MPQTTLVLLILGVITAAGLTLALALALSGGSGSLGFGLMGLGALLAAGITRWLAR